MVHGGAARAGEAAMNRWLSLCGRAASVLLLTVILACAAAAAVFFGVVSTLVGAWTDHDAPLGGWGCGLAVLGVVVIGAGWAVLESLEDRT